MQILNQAAVDAFRQAIREQGWASAHVLADFDGTLTKTRKDGKKVASIISVLRQNGDYLGEDYALRAQKLFDTYAPYESSEALPLAERKTKMVEWWTSHYALLKEKGLTREHLNRVLEAGLIDLKEKGADLLGFFAEQQVPVVIMSASGIGELIPLFFQEKGLLTTNMHVISNRMQFDEAGKFVKVYEPIVHSMNKDEVTVALVPEAEQAVHGRKNVLLLGDSPHDVDMVKGFAADQVLKVCFANESREELPERFETMKQLYDVIIEGDSVEPLLELLHQPEA